MLCAIISKNVRCPIERSFKIMKKKIKITLVTLLVLAMVGLAGCSGYSSSYVATLLVTTNDSDSARMSFGTFKGTKSFSMRFDDKSDKVLSYKAKLGSGSATIYYDTDGNKKELVKLTAGSEVEDSIPNFEKGQIIVIFETSEECKDGDISFELK